ncbi:LPS export ABC transporter periplasmic protein LptC [Mucilaginibacter dorajii]|uniref:LPS export ABC transporter periplasmic protein LptC n=1 Tax=Mucilaginibacter dorajii TaxID=692994 RepID=A0ABP7P8H7_9SPHI|nr:LPS export ABC transporter periplasmic protein LptC [Mucilaginibacter dorajii]MCS3735282.1 LPS export ABC transporter protein LptC [Mucilaginibacter dorajii]
MYKGAINIKGLCLVLLPLLALFASSCENDLNKVKEIASTEKGGVVVEPTTGLDVIMSDSAKVKLHLTAPLMLQYQTKKPYKLMPKGVKVVLYEGGIEKGTIIADTGIMHDDDKRLIEFHKNVVATNVKGETYKSDELFWDQVKKKVYSNKPVQVVMEGGNVLNGDTFESDDNFLHPSLKSSTGVFHVDEKVTQ